MLQFRTPPLPMLVRLRFLPLVQVTNLLLLVQVLRLLPMLQIHRVLLFHRPTPVLADLLLDLRLPVLLDSQDTGIPISHQMIQRI